MRLIEVLLRLGVSLVGWMIIYTHCVWTGTLTATGCGADGDALWRLLLGFAPITIGFCLLLNVSAKLHSVHPTLRWLAAPLVFFIPAALWAIWPTFVGATLEGQSICPGDPVMAWHFWWAPAQLAVFGIILWSVWRVWQVPVNET